MSIFSERLKNARKKSPFSQKELAEKIGIATRNYQRYESGENEPSLSTLAKLARFLDTSSDYLIGNAEFDRNPAIMQSDNLFADDTMTEEDRLALSNDIRQAYIYNTLHYDYSHLPKKDREKIEEYIMLLENKNKLKNKAK